MANALYAKGKEAILSGLINFTSDTIKVVLIDTNASTPYTYGSSGAADDALADVHASARIATATLTSKTITNGVFDAADITFTGVSAPGSSGTNCEAIIVYKEGASEANSWLIAYIDTANGLPVVPDGGNINVIWNSSGIFAI